MFHFLRTNGDFYQGRVDVPTEAALFPKEILIPPHAVAEVSYNIQRWTRMSAGGHFAALERPKEQDLPTLPYLPIF